MQTIARLLERLAAGEVEFVVVGGFAAVLHGSSQVTQDLDVCIEFTPENIERLRRHLSDLDPRHRMTAQKLSFIDTPPPGTELKNLYLRTKLGVVDFMADILGVGDFRRLRERARSVQVGGNAIRVIALDDLIAAKEALGRDKDLLVAKELRVIALREAGRIGGGSEDRS